MVGVLAPVLEEVIVLEVSSDLGAAYGGRVLSDMGARVIKVAPLDFDDRIERVDDQSTNRRRRRGRGLREGSASGSTVGRKLDNRSSGDCRQERP